MAAPSADLGVTDANFAIVLLLCIGPMRTGGQEC
jgi:hypothetical protein